MTIVVGSVKGSNILMNIVPLISWLAKIWKQKHKKQRSLRTPNEWFSEKLPNRSMNQFVSTAVKVRFWHVGSKSWKILHSLRTNSEFTPGHRPFNPNKEGQTSVNHPFSGAMMAMLVFREGVQVVFWELARHLQDDVKHFQYGDPHWKRPATGILEGLS